MFCKNCGNKIDGDSIYCNYCGYILKFDKVSYENKITIINELKNEVEKLSMQKQELQKEIEILNKESIVSSYDYSDYETLSSIQCKNELAILKTREKDLIKENRAIINMNYENNTKIISNNIKQLLRCFNCECDNVFLSLNYKNIDTSRNKIAKIYESLIK